MKRGASATHARTTTKGTPRRRALLAGLFANGLVQAAGAGLLAFAVERAFDGAVSRLMLAAAFGVAAAALVWLRARERADAARLGAEYAYALGPAVDAARLGATRRWVAAAARLAASGATVLGALGALAVVDAGFALAAVAAIALGALGALAAGAVPQAMDARARAIALAGETAAFLVPAAVVVAGVGRTGPGTIAAGLVVAAVLAAALRDAAAVPVTWADAAAEKLRNALAVSAAAPVPAPVPPQPLDDGDGWLVFDGATVEGVLEDLTVAAEPGAVIAVIGDAGAGKSTLAALAGRLVDPDEGAISLDGQDLRELAPEELARAVGVAGPALPLPLMRGDLDKDLRRRWAGAPDSELERVLSLTDLEDLIDAPRRSLTEVQRERLALASALVGDPRVLVIDDVDALLEGGGAGVLDRVLADRRGRRTTLLVTQWPELAATADMVWRLSEGRLIAVGPP